MVKEIINTYYKCPYCGHKYGKYQEAQDCANFCVEADAPEVLTETTIVCEICNKKQINIEGASACEEKHRVNNDWRYEEYLRLQSFVALDIAQKHPAQSRITAFMER